MGSPTPLAVDLVFLQFPDGIDFNLSNRTYWNSSME